MATFFMPCRHCLGVVVALLGILAADVSAQDQFGPSPFAPLEQRDQGPATDTEAPEQGKALEQGEAIEQGKALEQERESSPEMTPGFRPEGSNRPEGSPRPDRLRGALDAIDAYQVRMTESNYLAGRLQVFDPYSGKLRGVRRTDLLIIQDGDVVSRAQTGVDGVVQIKNLPEGEYSVVAIGPDGLAAFGFEVLPVATGVAASPYRFDVLLVPGRDVGVAQRSICMGDESCVACVGDDPTLMPVPTRHNWTPGSPLMPIPASTRLGAVRPASAIESISAGQFEDGEVQHVSAPLKGQPILLRDSESGRGQLVILTAAGGEPVGLANARLSLIRSGQILATIETDERGYCGMVGLGDGVYSMVGVGSNGFIALGVRVQTASAGPKPVVTASANSRTRGEVGGAEYVHSVQYGPAPVGWRVAGAQLGAIGYAPGFACGGCGEVGCCGGCGVGPCGGPCGPMAGACGFGGGFGMGGFGGGGGGFGGGGVLGALLGAGLGAAIGAAIASDDDNDDPSNPVDPRPRPPVSPYLPPR